MPSGERPYVSDILKNARSIHSGLADFAERLSIEFPYMQRRQAEGDYNDPTQLDLDRSGLSGLWQSRESDLLHTLASQIELLGRLPARRNGNTREYIDPKDGWSIYFCENKDAFFYTFDYQDRTLDGSNDISILATNKRFPIYKLAPEGISGMRINTKSIKVQGVKLIEQDVFLIRGVEPFIINAQYNRRERFPMNFSKLFAQSSPVTPIR